MLKPRKTQNPYVPVPDLIDYNNKIFWNTNIEDDPYTPINNREENYIQEEELKQTLKENFKVNKSSGLSNMPL